MSRYRNHNKSCYESQKFNAAYYDPYYDNDIDPEIYDPSSREINVYDQKCCNCKWYRGDCVRPGIGEFDSPGPADWCEYWEGRSGRR